MYGELRDGQGTPVADAWENVFFGATGDVALIGANPFSTDAAIASILVQTETASPRGAIYALCIVREGGRARVLSAAVPAGADPQPYEVRVAADGSEPGPASRRHAGPIEAAGLVRAALFVGGRPVVRADEHAAKFRIAGSTAPEAAR